MLGLPITILLLLVLPLAGSALLIALARRFGEPLAGYVGTGIAMATFGASIVAMVSWIERAATWGFEKAPLVDVVPWIPVGVYEGQRFPGFLNLAIYVDSLTIIMIVMVSFVSALVHLFSLGYMRGDKRYPQFFSYLSLFTFCMIGLLMSGTLLQLLIFWELVGLCSYLLIGFWRDKPEAGPAAIKAFVMNRVGDTGFIVGMAILICILGNVTLPDLWLTLGEINHNVFPHWLLTIVGVLLLCGAIGKSAQFPLHTWLPDAMAGPTPVSALIHAATMVAAGVFLLARIYPILTPDARLVVIIVGGTTILIGSLCALAQRDIKRALAFSTIAQLGYMVLAIGVGSWIGAMFHLLTHAFFKSLLFLGAGQVIHAMHHQSRLENYGGLFWRMPVTAVTFAIAGLAMSGAPFLSGFYSKEMIIAHTAAWTGLASEGGRGAMLQLVLWVPVVAAYLTPLYMTRLWMLTFAGRTRRRSLFKRTGELGVMSFPLVMLAGMTIVAGYDWFPVQQMVGGTLKETRGYYTAMLPNTRIDPLETTWPTLAVPGESALDEPSRFELQRTPAEQRVEVGYERAFVLTGWAWLVGVVTGVAIWWKGFTVTDRLRAFAPFRAVQHWLANRMYFDDLYDLVFVGAVQMMTGLVVALDRWLIDPLIDAIARAAALVGIGVARLDDAAVDGTVRGISASIWQGGAAVRLAHGGRVRVYVASAVGLLTLAGAVIAIMIVR